MNMITNSYKTTFDLFTIYKPYTFLGKNAKFAIPFLINIMLLFLPKYSYAQEVTHRLDGLWQIERIEVKQENTLSGALLSQASSLVKDEVIIDPLPYFHTDILYKAEFLNDSVTIYTNSNFIAKGRYMLITDILQMDLDEIIQSQDDNNYIPQFSISWQNTNSILLTNSIYTTTQDKEPLTVTFTLTMKRISTESDIISHKYTSSK